MTQGVDANWVYRVSRMVLSACITLWRGWEAEGIENVPRAGRVIIASNHLSLLDPPLVSMAVFTVRRFVKFMAKQELFSVPGIGWLLRQYGGIPLDRKRADVGAIRSALEVLDMEGCMAVFPEGTRSKTGEPGRPKPGVGLLALKAQAPVVPARIRETGVFFSRRPIRIRFGEPIRFPEKDGREACQEFAQKVMAEIFKL